MYMKYKTLRFLSLLFLAVIVSVGARAAADSHNPYTAEAKRYDKQPSEKVMEAAKKLADAGDSQKAIILYTLVCRRFRADMPEKEKQTCILAHVEVSKLYITSASYIKALDLGVEGVKLSEECEKQPHVAKLYNLIGNAYTYFLDYEKGMNYYKKALAFCRKYPDRETEYKILCNMTNLCVQQHNLKEANRYYKMSERVRDHKNDLATYMSSYTQGRIEMGRGIYAKQIARYRHLADYAEKHKLPAKFTCYAFEQIYLCFREMHQNDSVVKYLHVCYETAKRKGVLFHFTGAIRSLANHYDEVGDIAKANDYKTQYIAIEDSSKNTREFDMMKNKLFLHEVEQTTKEIDTLHEKEQAGKRTIRQQQAVIAGITIVCLCVCIFFFVIYRQKRKLNDSYLNLFRQNKDNLEMQKKMEHLYRENASELEEKNKLIALLQSQLQEQGKIKGAHAAKEAVGKYQDSNLKQEQQEIIAQKIMAVMEQTTEYCQTDFSLDKLAKLVGSNSKYVSQVINDSFKKNFNAFVNTYRIQTARERLIDVDHYGNLTIKGIAESVGFKSPTTFINVFKKIVGLSPSVYQNMAKKDVEA